MNTFVFHIAFYDLVLLGEAFVGLTFVLLLCFAKSIHTASNRILALALAAGCLGLIWPALQLSLAFGPLLYFYVLKTTRAEYRFRRVDLLHFGPLLLQATPVAQAATLASVCVYLYLSQRHIAEYYRELRFNDGDRWRNELRWLQRWLWVYSFLWLVWLCEPPVYLLLNGLLIGLAATAYLKVVNQAAAIRPGLLSGELRQKGAWLKKVMQAERYYLDPELSLNALAAKLRLGPHELSRIINTALKKSFNDFINEYRVRAVMRKMGDPRFDHITLLGIAYESGFNSQSTFSRIFRQVTGKSPQEYKKERPSYKLGSRGDFQR